MELCSREITLLMCTLLTTTALPPPKGPGFSCWVWCVSCTSCIIPSHVLPWQDAVELPYQTELEVFLFNWILSKNFYFVLIDLSSNLFSSTPFPWARSGYVKMLWNHQNNLTFFPLSHPSVLSHRCHCPPGSGGRRVQEGFTFCLKSSLIF